MQFLGVFFGYAITVGVLDKVTGGRQGEYSSTYRDNLLLRMQDSLQQAHLSRLSRQADAYPRAPQQS